MVTGLRRRSAAGYAVLIGLFLAFLLPPAMPAAASGGVWLATQQATFSATNKSVPSIATYRNHAYILWLSDPLPGHTYYQVYYTTNASGAWKTRLLAGVGPEAGGALDGPRMLIAVDPTVKRLYAVWPVATGLILYTSDNEGATWHGPITLVKDPFPSAISPDIALAAGGGKVAVAFHGGVRDFGKGACKEIGLGDIFVLTYNGTTGSPPQNVTSCSSDQANGFRTQQLAYDETTGRFSLVALDDSGKFRLWFAQGSGATWSKPALTPMTHLVTGAGNFYNGDYRVAATGGATYVAYPLSTKPGAGFSNVDVYLAMHRPGQGWAVQRVTHDPLDCQKFDVALAARPDRVALAYRFGVWCAKPGGPHEEYIHVLTGLPGHFQEVVPFKPPIPSGCLRPVLATDGNVFRVLQVCHNVGAKGGNLFYTPEFDDVVGPTTHITGISAAGSGAIRVAWSAQDPTPGSGVAYAQVEVRVDGGAWQTVVAATQASFIVYTHAQPGKTYTFRVRARDKVNNWGAWVTATIQAT
jgi:hypothetical protein